jgi:hypothetical protein
MKIMLVFKKSELQVNDVLSRTNVASITLGVGIAAFHTVSGIPEFFFSGDSTNSVEDRGQREWGYGGGSR